MSMHITDDEIIARCTAAGIKWEAPAVDPDFGLCAGFFVVCHMDAMRKLLATPYVAPVEPLIDRVRRQVKELHELVEQQQGSGINSNKAT